MRYKQKTLNQAIEEAIGNFYNEDATDNHTVVTPLDLCYNVLSNVSSLDGTILVIANIEWLYVLRDKFNRDMSEITFVTPCENKKAAVQQLFPTVNTVVGNLLEMEVDMNFDYIITNPPYLKSMHLKFLLKATGMCNKELIFIHPSAWLIKESKRSVVEEKCIELVKEHHTEFTFFKGRTYFGVTQFSPCTITHIHINKKPDPTAPITIYDESVDRTWVFNNIDDINTKSDSHHYFEFRQHIASCCKQHGTVGDHIMQRGNYYVSMPTIRGSGAINDDKHGGVAYKDLFTMLPINVEIIPNEINAKQFIGFNTIDEATNYIAYLKTDFARMCLSLLKFDNAVNKTKMGLIPWLDFTRPWSDDEIYTEFNINQDWKELIKDVIAPFYK